MIETDELIYSRYLAEHAEDDFRTLLERHRESLVLFLYSYVHSMEDAEELMLDAFAEAAAGAGFSGRSTFKTWLFSIGKKKGMMRLRKQRRVPICDETNAESEDLPEFGVLRKERNLQLYRALRRLKTEYRQVLILLYFEQMSPEEAARVMGKTRKQTYNLAERGKKALRSELEGMGYDNAQYR